MHKLLASPLIRLVSPLSGLLPNVSGTQSSGLLETSPSLTLRDGSLKAEVQTQLAHLG